MERLSALIIMDEENEGLFRSLQMKGERLVLCSLKDALDHLKQEKTDIVVLDCGYRVWTGLSTMLQIKKTYPDVPVIFLTDMSSEDIAINAFKLGAREYYKKPVNVLELRRTLERLLSIKRAAEGCLSTGDGGQNALCIKSVARDKPQNIVEVISYIEGNLWSPLELEHLAEKAHLSKFHFCRIFKRHIGMNPMKFVAALRIERAKELLKKNDLPVSLVASEVGFKDLSNFIRQFKKVTGVTPTTYRGTARIETGSEPIGTFNTPV
jgi:YesN/AraC family two-component response regulator